MVTEWRRRLSSRLLGGDDACSSPQCSRDCRYGRKRDRCRAVVGNLWRRSVLVDHAGRAVDRRRGVGAARSLSVNVVVEDVLGAPAFGVKTRASSSLVIAAAVPRQLVDPGADGRQAAEPRAVASVPPAPPRVIVSVSVAPTFASPIVTCANGLTGVSEVVVWPAPSRQWSARPRVAIDHAGRAVDDRRAVPALL